MIHVPPVLHKVFLMGAALAVSISGGKDGQAMLNECVAMWHERQYPGQIFAIFADLGRIEWAGVYEHCQRMAKENGVELIVVKRPQGGMIERWEQRLESIAKKSGANVWGEMGDKPFWSSSTNRYCTDHLKVQQIDKTLRKVGDKPFWSSSANRYCTAELKRNQIDKELKLYTNPNLVVCAVGIRSDESPKRAKEPHYSVRSNITTETLKEPKWVAQGSIEEQQQWADQALQIWLTECYPEKQRLAFTWHPIKDWTVDQVWEACGTSREDIARRVELYRDGFIWEAFEGFPLHWAYATGNTRLSCSMCVMASGGDIANGAAHNPDVWIELAEMEIRSGWSFRHKLHLASLGQKVNSLGQYHLQQLHQTLIKLGLITPVPVQIGIRMLAISAWRWLIAYWLIDALEEIDNDG